MSGGSSPNTPASMWTQCEHYVGNSRVGTIVVVSASYGGSTKELMTVVSPSMETLLNPLSELLTELQELWPLVREF